jgi:hypothetical protein
MARSFTIRKSSCLSEGVHHHCRLEKTGEVDGKFGKQLFLDFRATEGPEEGKAIRAYAGIESESGPVSPSLSNKLGRLLAGLAGLEDIDGEVEIDVDAMVGKFFTVTVVPSRNGNYTVEKVAPDGPF